MVKPPQRIYKEEHTAPMVSLYNTVLILINSKEIKALWLEKGCIVAFFQEIIISQILNENLFVLKLCVSWSLPLYLTNNT